MKSLMTTTALVVATALPVVAAENENQEVFMNYNSGEKTSSEILASDLIGMRVYTSETDVEEMAQVDASTDWNDIGEVSDVVMSRDGSTESILLDIGGFLGMGEKTVAVNFDKLKFVADEDDRGDFFLVFSADQQMLEEAEAFNFEQIGEWTSAKWQEAEASAKSAMNKAKTSVSETAESIKASSEETYEEAKEATLATADKVEQSTEEAAREVENAAADAEASVERTAQEIEQSAERNAEDAEQTAERAAPDLTAPAIEREGFEAFETADLTSEMLTGAAVYDTNDEWIGEVSELIIDEQGSVKEAILDVGGFLGIGEKSVATEMKSLTIKRATEGKELRVYVDATKEQLENMPTYNDS